MLDYLHQGRRLMPFTDTTAAAALHVVGQLPYSWFVKLSDTYWRFSHKTTQDFKHWFRSIYAALSVRGKQRDGEAKKLI